MASSAVRLIFNYSETDYVRAMRAHYASYLRVRRDICIVVASGVAAAYLWPSASFHWLGVMLLVLSVAVTLILIAAFIVIPPWVFRRNPKLRDEYSFEISPEGIHYSTLHIDTRLQWSLFTRTLIDSHSYLLYWDSRAFVLIPKRVFQTREQQTTFEQLLAEYVPEKAGKIRP
jgi:hypothetical protein